MEITVVEGDITQQQVDAVVNAANNAMRGGGGVDGAIHRAGGRAVLDDCVARFPHGLATGDAGWTTAGEMPARWVIHVVGPNRHAGQTDRSLLTSCYVRALEVADELGARTVAFPLVSAGVYGWPKDDAIAAPLEVFRSADTRVEEARLVAFDHATYEQIRSQLLTERVTATVRPMVVRWLVAVALLASLCACGDPVAESVTATSAAEPFTGDLSGKQGAERALECTGATYRRGIGDLEDGLEEVGASPGLGLDHWLDPEGWLGELPLEGYALERADDDRALLSFDADGRTVIAFVMRDGLTDYMDDEGWGVESYAMCDPAEWPAETTDALNIGVWTDDLGQRVSVNTIRSLLGSEHCDWQDTTWLWLGKDGKQGEFLGTPDRELERYLRTTYDAHAELPGDARDTGFSRDGRHLWLAADGSAAYLVAANGDAELWPASKRPIRCA